MNKRHKLLRRVFSTVMALVLAVSLLPTYAFAASVPTSTTTDGNAADFTGAWKSAHYKPGTYTVTANLSMPGKYNPILTGVTVYANNPDNPFGATDPDDPCENVNTGATPTTPLKDNATLTVKEDGTLELNLGIHNPIFTTQKVGTCSNLAYTATRLEKTYTSGENSINGRVYKLDATLGKVDLDANGVATYNFKGSELYALPLALSFKPDGDIALQLTVDLSTIPLVADYSAVTAALAKVPADLSIYTDETAAAVTAAVNAVVYDKTPDQQAEVDAMAKAIEDAVAALVKKDGAVDPDPTPDPAPTKPTRTQPLDLCIGAETGKGVCESKHTSIDMLSSEGWKWEQNADGKGGTLTLRNFYLYGTPEGAAAANAYNHMWLCMSGEVTVILEGTNIIEINDPYFSAIIGTHCGEADDLHMTIKEGTPGASLEVKLADGLKLSGSFPYATAQSFKLESGTVKTNMYMGPFGAKTVEVAGGLLDIDISETAKLLPDEQIFGITSYNTALVVSGGKLRVNGGNFAGIYDGTLPALAEEQAPSLTVKGSGSLELSGADYGAYIAGGDITIDTTGDIVINAPEVGLITSGSIYVNNVGSYTNTAAKGLAVTSTSTGGVYGKSADYTAVDAALAKVPADLTAYTQDTADAVTAAVNAVVRGKIFLEQAAVDKMAADIETAVAALKAITTEVSGTSADGVMTVTIKKVPGKTGIDLDNTTIDVIKLNLEPYGYTIDTNYAIVVKTNGEVCQNWVAGENVMTLTAKLGDYQKLGWSGTWLWSNGNMGNSVDLFENASADKADSYKLSEDGTTATVDIIPENYPSANASKHINEVLQRMADSATATKLTPSSIGGTITIGMSNPKYLEPVVTDYTYDGKEHFGLTYGSYYGTRIDGELKTGACYVVNKTLNGVTTEDKYSAYILNEDLEKHTEVGTYTTTLTISPSKIGSNYRWTDGTTEPKTITWSIKPESVSGTSADGKVTATVSQVVGKTGIDLSKTTVEVVRIPDFFYGYNYNRGYAVVVKVDGQICQNWVAGENTLSISTKLESKEKLAQLGHWIWANGNFSGGVNAFADNDEKFSNYTVSEGGVATVDILSADLKTTASNTKYCNQMLQEMYTASTADKANLYGSNVTSYIGLSTPKTVEPVVTNFEADGQPHFGLKKGFSYNVRVDGQLVPVHNVDATRVVDGQTDVYGYGVYVFDSDIVEQTEPGVYSVKVYISDNRLSDNYTWADGTTEPKTITWTITGKAETPAAVEGLVYTGESQTGVTSGKGYTLTGETAINAGTHTATAALLPGYTWADGSTDPIEITYTIAKATPAVSVDAMTAVYGQKLSELTLPEGFAWVEGDTELTTAGEQTFTAIYTPADTDNYNTVEVAVTVNVQYKTAETPAAIEGLVYTGKSQTGVTAGLGYTLTGETAVNAGTHTATAALLPGYAWADGSTDPVEITYTIAKADPTVTRGDFNVPYGTKLGELTLEEGFAWAEGTDLETALTEGTYPVTLIYTPADTENYNTLTLTVNVIVAANEIGAPVIADGSDTEWAYGSSSGLTTKVSGNPGALLSVAVDGTEISDANYTVGDDTVVLNPSYLQTLAKGEHTLTLNYEGGSVSTTFTVKDGTKEVLVTRLKPGTYTITANIWFDKADSGLPMNPHLTNSSFPPKDPVTDNATLRVDANGRALVTVPIVIQSKVMTIQKIKGLNIVDSTRDANGNLTSVTVDLGVLENFSDVITKLCTISLKMGDLAMSISGFDRDQTWRAHFQVNLAGVPTEQVTKTITIGQDGTEVSPETGDSSSVTLFAGMMTVSVLAAAVLVYSRKRREENAD